MNPFWEGVASGAIFGALIAAPMSWHIGLVWALAGVAASILAKKDKP